MRDRDKGRQAGSQSHNTCRCAHTRTRCLVHGHMRTNTCSSVSCSVGETRAEVGQMSSVQRVKPSYRFGPFGHGFVAPTGPPLTTTFCFRTYHLCLSEQEQNRIFTLQLIPVSHKTGPQDDNVGWRLATNLTRVACEKASPRTHSVVWLVVSTTTITAQLSISLAYNASS
jgi:hypothetical protein